MGHPGYWNLANCQSRANQSGSIFQRIDAAEAAARVNQLQEIFSHYQVNWYDLQALLNRVRALEAAVWPKAAAFVDPGDA